MSPSVASASKARTTAILSAALVALAVLPFLGTLSFGYIFDDTALIRSNRDIRGWGALVHLWSRPYWATEGPASDLYRPVLTSIWALIWNAGGGHPVWFHLAAVVAHAAATLMLWNLLRRGMGQGAATLAAAWFALNPLHVEAVANSSNSSEVFVTIVTLALVGWIARIDRMTPHGRSAPWRAAAIAACVYATALLTKESGAMAAPLALLCMWGWNRSPSTTNSTAQLPIGVFISRWRPLIVGFAIAALGVAALRRAVLGGFVSGGSFAASGLDTLSGPQRVVAMLALAPKVLRLLFWPDVMNPFYGPTSIPSGPAAVAVAASVVVCLLAALVIAGRVAAQGDRRMLVALCWAPLAFLPASNLLVATGQVLAERTLYLPSVGVAMCIGLAANAVDARLALFHASIVRPARLLGAALLAVAVALLFFITSARAHVWGDHERLFAQMITADSASHRGYWLLGMVRRNQGRPSEALVLLARAYRAYPRERQLRVDYAETLIGQRQPAAAARVAAGLMEWPELRSDPGAVRLYLGALGAAFGPDSVVAAGTRIWRAKPSRVAALEIGQAYTTLHDSAAARSVYRAALSLRTADTVGAAALRQRLAALER